MLRAASHVYGPMLTIRPSSPAYTHSIGAAGNQNVQGEDQKKLDVLSNEIMINALKASGKVAVLVSEEDDEAIIVGERQSGATFETEK